MCTLYLPIQWVYEVLDCSLWSPHGVEQCKIAALHANYEKNPMITADIYTTILDLAFI